MKVTGYVFDSDIGAYREKPSGSVVGDDVVLSWLDEFVNEEIAADLIGLSQAHLVGDSMNIDAWYQAFTQTLKDLWLSASMIGNGGPEQMTPAAYGQVGGNLAFEYRRARMFADAVANGDLSDAQILHRTKLYTGGYRAAFYEGVRRAKLASKATHERRILNPGEHCEDCVRLALMGPQPIGTLPVPGKGTQCLHNCLCSMVFGYFDNGEFVVIGER